MLRPQRKKQEAKHQVRSYLATTVPTEGKTKEKQADLKPEMFSMILTFCVFFWRGSNPFSFFLNSLTHLTPVQRRTRCPGPAPCT